MENVDGDFLGRPKLCGDEMTLCNLYDSILIKSSPCMIILPIYIYLYLFGIVCLETPCRYRVCVCV